MNPEAKEPKNDDRFPSHSKEGVGRMGHILQSLGSIVSKRSVSIEANHIGAQITLKDGIKAYIITDSDDLSSACSLEALGSDAVFLFTFRSRSEAEAGKQSLLSHFPEDAVVKMTKDGIFVAGNIDDVDDPKSLVDIVKQRASDIQKMGLSLFLSNAADQLDDEG